MPKENLLIPAMLDAHFPLMKYAFYSRRYQPVILNNRRGITELGLRYVHNDMCYPCILNVGQMLAALRSGRFDLPHTKLLMPTVGDSCRGSNYCDLLKKAVRAAGFAEVETLTMNLRHIDNAAQLPITPLMVWRALFSLYYGDILLILTQQVRPHEQEPGAANRLRDRWYRVLGDELLHVKHLTIPTLIRRFREIAESFDRIPRDRTEKQRIGLVGDLFTKYCAIGNWDMVDYLEQNGCESYTNGLSWYVLYYIDSHLRTLSPPEAALYRTAGAALTYLQKRMVSEIQRAGFFSLPPLPVLKEEVCGLVSFEAAIGDGWLIGTECAGYIRHCKAKKVLAVQPFGCMANIIAGRGIYSSLARRAGGQIVSVDVDASGSPVNAYNRARMLIDATIV